MNRLRQLTAPLVALTLLATIPSSPAAEARVVLTSANDKLTPADLQIRAVAPQPNRLNFCGSPKAN